MTKHEALKLLTVGDNDLPFVELSKDEAKAIRDLIDPPKHPKTGAFVEWRPKGKPDNADYVPGLALTGGVRTTNGNILLWDEIEYRRVCTVTPPTLISWRPTDVAWHCFEHVAWLSHGEEPPLADARSGKHIMTITREEMEASGEVG